MPGQKLAPAQIARALRAKFPGQLDDLDDVQIMRGLKAKDPATYADLMDPLLEGAELLSPMKQPTRPSARAVGAGPVSAANLPPPPPPLPPAFGDQLVATGLRVVPSVAGSFGGPAIGAASGFAGEALGQGYEYLTGQREEFSPSVMFTEAGLNAVPMAWARRFGTAGRLAATAGQGAVLSTSSLAMRKGIEEGKLLTGEEALTAGGMGAGFGLGVGGAAEGIGAVARRAPSFGDATGALPGGPPPPMSPVDRAVITQAAQVQFDVEEARIAQQFHTLYGESASQGRRTDFHTALQAKDYLKQLADLNVSKQQVGQVLESVGTAQTFDPLTTSPYTVEPPPLQLPPGRGDPNAIRAYPPGAQPEIELVGSGAPPASRIIGGRDVGAVQPPPSFEQALESSLQAEPGPPRLVRPMELSSQNVPRGIIESDRSNLLPPPRPSFEGPIRSPQMAELGGAPPSLDQPRLPDITAPRPIDRTYTTGPNAGPRREGEAHGQSRAIRRQVQTGKTISYETAPSVLRAEDPGTYPPEVRRELAAMAWELETFLPESYGGGSTRGQLDALTEEMGTISGAVAEARRRGAITGGRMAGAPVRKDILDAARGSFAHATREEMLQMIRAALLEGKGNGLTDAAAQVARRRLAARAQGLTRTSTIRAQRGDEGDALIGWEDATGARALPDQDLDDFQRVARDLDDGEILALDRLWREHGSEGFPEDILPHYVAARTEGVRRGLMPPEQLDLRMEGPGGAGGPKVADFEGGPPSLDERVTQFRQQRVAQQIEAGARRRAAGTDVPDNPTAQQLEQARRAADQAGGQVGAPPPAAPPMTPQQKLTAGRQGSLLDQLLREEGVLIFNVPAGNREMLKKWLQKQEAAEGGEAWFSRVEQAIEDGEWDRAFRVAAGASVRSVAAAYKNASGDPGKQAQISSAVRGTPLQDDLNTQIIAGARQRAGVGDAPPVKDFPPSQRVTQAGATRGRATIGPAGVLDPGPRKRPLSVYDKQGQLNREGSAAPALRAGTLDREVVRLIMEGVDEVEGLATIPGNTDTYLRLFRQVGDQIYKGKNLKLLRDAGVKIPPEELAQHWNATISDAGRTLQLMSSFAQAHREVLTEAAEAMSMGGALRGVIKGAPPVYSGARGRVASPAGQKATQEVIDEIAERTSRYQATALANDLQKRTEVGPLKALHDASYAFMLSKWNTAVRNYVSFTGRYGMDSLDHALTIPLARLTGDEPTATLSSALLKERGLTPFRTGTAVTPKQAWSEDLQGIYNFTADNLSALKPKDARLAIRLLLDAPDHMTHYLGAMTGEDLSAAHSTTPVLRHLVNPKVQRVLTMFNRAQEFSARATVFDATTRALIRAKGLDPSTILSKPTPEIIQAVGGAQAFDDLMFVATSQALEATFAGRTSKDSLPGALIRFINEAWPLKLGMPFPRFNISSAPRWIYDHSPAALLDLVRFPLDRAGVTAPKGTVAGGRLYRGVRAQEIQRVELPALQLKIGQAEKAQGTALQELLGTQREFQVRQRQITRLQKRASDTSFTGMDALEQARTLQDQLARRRERLKSTIQEQKAVVGDLKSEQKKLLNRVVDATGINAPNFAQYLARIGVGTVGMLGAAWVVRSQDGAEGTRWYEYRVDREGKDPIILDFRPFAPFAQYLFVADVANDFYRYTDWDAVRADVGTEEEGLLASPLDWSRAMWNHYEGKYTEAELGSQFAQAFLSISRAAGTTLTLTDLMTQNGWPSLEDAARAVVGTIGQFTSRFTVPGQQISDVVGQFNEEEAKVRTPPKATTEDWERPLAAPLANIPGVRQLIPERISQTTGQPVAAEYPLLRALAGIGTAPRDFITEEVRRVGVPGQSVFIRETGDYGLDRLVAETYSRYLKEELPLELESAEYRALGSPALQRDYLQKVFPRIKRWTMQDVQELLGEERFEGTMVVGEEARRRARQQRMVEGMLEELGPAPPDQPDDQVGEPPPAFDFTPPPPAF